uniref:Ig-like domain-containing protein n=1 Tax=Salmo trutta TaxID=8032 RepID=A0A674CA88_SALTR
MSNVHNSGTELGSSRRATWHIDDVKSHCLLLYLFMMDNGEPGLAMFKNIFNGISEEYAMYYNTTHVTYNAGKILLGWDWKMQAYNINKFENYYLPICIKHLKTLLKREKNIVMRKVPPRLRLIKKEVSGGFQVSCLAFGSTPATSNLTLLRDGQPVAEQELTGGEVLPSGDGTYQLRKSLEVSTEELKKRHNYTCTASHLSLDNKLDVSWESGAERVHLSTLSGVTGGVFGCPMFSIGEPNV